MSLVSVVCNQAEVSASASSLVQRSSTYCEVSECDCAASIMRRPWPVRSVAPWGGEGDIAFSSNSSVIKYFLFFQDIPVLMLPSLLVQLFAETSLALMHPVFYLVSGGSDTRYGLLAVAACITFIGKTTISCR
jgi:hypothetical protein